MAIEFADELVFGIREAAWPLIRADLGISYAAVGLLLSLPGLVAAAVEPAFGVLGDAGLRHRFVVAGGVAFAISLTIAGLATGFPLLMASFLLMYPASGAFVSLSEATLMDLDPGQRERNMARWTLAGSFGVVVGPLLLAGAAAAHLSWRGLFLALACGFLPLTLLAHAFRAPQRKQLNARSALAALLGAVRRWTVLRWLLVIEIADLMGDVLLGFLALYLVDVGHLAPAVAALGVGAWTAGGLAGDALLLPVLARVDSRLFLRVTALVALVLYPAFLVGDAPITRLALVAVLGGIRAGWYAIPKAKLFGELAETSGVAVALSSLSSALGYLSPLAIGLAAAAFGLASAMWLPLLAPVAVLAASRAMRGRAGELG